MLDGIEEFYFLLYLLVVIVGIELSIFSIYKYQRGGYKQLPLDRMLFSIGLLYLIFDCSFFIFAINQVVITSNVLSAVLSMLTIFIIQVSIFPILLLVVIKEFSQIMHSQVNYLFMGIQLVLIVLNGIFNPLFSTITIIIKISTISVIIVYFVYLFREIRKKTSGEIKKRLQQVIIGTFINYLSLVFNLNIFIPFIYNNVAELLIVVGGIILLIGGYLFVFYGIYKFPTFYEVQWKENLIKLFIINQKKNSLLYSSDFSEGSKSMEDEIKKKYKTKSKKIEHFFTGGLEGIDKILSEISQSEDKQLQEIKKGDVVVLLEYGSGRLSHIVYVLVVEKALKSYKIFLNKIKNQFESFYKQLLLEDFERDKEKLLFKNFDLILQNLIV
ncbi:MAG: membrane protein of unknown function [Promethearchaeota archaeon]|nr:MAG: membrane protein of unknown function [Candidatus Lokiarchaeota archaeon]